MGSLASAVASKLSSAMSSAVMSFAASWWSGGGGGVDDEEAVDATLVGEGEDVYLPADDTTRAPLKALDQTVGIHDATRTVHKVPLEGVCVGGGSGLICCVLLTRV